MTSIKMCVYFLPPSALSITILKVDSFLKICKIFGTRCIFFMQKSKRKLGIDFLVNNSRQILLIGGSNPIEDVEKFKTTG